jgi:hypothetical protein
MSFRRTLLNRIILIVGEGIQKKFGTSCRSEKQIGAHTSFALSGLRAEGILVEPHHRGIPGAIINRHHVETAGALADMPFRKKLLRGANHQMLFLPSDAQFRLPWQIFADGARSHFHKCQRPAIIND